MKIAVSRDKYRKGLPSEEAVDTDFDVMLVSDAIEKQWGTDAHCVLYTVPGRNTQPRINKDGIERCVQLFGVVPEISVFFADVDNPGHAVWADEGMAAAIEKLGELDTAGFYMTARGYRIVQPISEPIVVTKVEKYIRRWLHGLLEKGFPVDMTCKDWTRAYRMAHVLRDGRRYTSPHVSL